MVRTSRDGSLGAELGALIGRAATGAILATIALLGLGLIAEILRRRHRARRLLRLLDLTLPLGVRTAVVSLLAVVATLTGPRPVGATETVRGWLGQVSASTTTTTRVVVATPDAVSERAEPTTAPTGPVVLIPPATAERLEPSPPVPSSPPAPAAPSRSYVVKPGDCLWSIAAAILGPAADGHAIDAGWRQIYAANHAAIGDDPNLIHIGLTLELPPLVAQP